MAEKHELPTSQIVLDYLYSNNVRADITVEDLAEGILDLLCETDRNPCHDCQEFVCDGCGYAESGEAK